MSTLNETSAVRIDEKKKEMDDDIREQQQLFFDYIIQTQGELIANMLSNSHSLPPSGPKCYIEARLDVFL